MSTKASPYLENSLRLADVLTAIQVLGSYKWATRTPDAWQGSLGKVMSAESWSEVFNEHPEFFRVNDEGKVTLRWRHGYDRAFSVKLARELSQAEIDALSPEERNSEISRRTLESTQIEALLKTAIELHERAIAHAEERRWLTPLLFGLLGTIVGVVLQAALK
jgi:hypothetical protein